MIFSLDSPINRKPGGPKDADRIELGSFTFSPKNKTVSFQYTIGHKTVDGIIWDSLSPLISIIDENDYDTYVGLLAYQVSDAQVLQVQARLFDYLVDEGILPTGERGDRTYIPSITNAADIDFDDTTASLGQTTIQGALEDLDSRLDTIEANPPLSSGADLVASTQIYTLPQPNSDYTYVARCHPDGWYDDVSGNTINPNYNNGAMRREPPYLGRYVCQPQNQQVSWSPGQGPINVIAGSFSYELVHMGTRSFASDSNYTGTLVGIIDEVAATRHTSLALINDGLQVLIDGVFVDTDLDWFLFSSTNVHVTCLEYAILPKDGDLTKEIHYIYVNGLRVFEAEGNVRSALNSNHRARVGSNIKWIHQGIKANPTLASLGSWMRKVVPYAV